MLAEPDGYGRPAAAGPSEVFREPEHAGPSDAFGEPEHARPSEVLARPEQAGAPPPGVKQADGGDVGDGAQRPAVAEQAEVVEEPGRGEQFEQAEPPEPVEQPPPPDAGPWAPNVSHRRPRRRRRPFLVGVLIFVVLALIAGAIGYAHVRADINPPGPPGRLVTVRVPRGASTLSIADLLAKAGVIHGADVFEVYLKLHGGGPLLAGTYRLRTNEAYKTVIAQLERGPVLVTYKLVVPEGFTVRQIAAAVGRLKTGISATVFLAAATSGQVRSPYEPARTNDLEGLLFPATYPVPQGETATALVRWMVATFDTHAAQLGLTSAANRLHYSPYQVVKVASIVEREAKLEQDRGPIASVIYNRLARGMPIGAESTLLYGLGNPSGNPSITTPNPYNTLINKGLPPTPIANPGIPSLRAAMDPPQTSYLFWVEINPDGEMGFATTEAQFKQLQRDCRKVHLC